MAEATGSQILVAQCGSGNFFEGYTYIADFVKSVLFARWQH